MQTFLPFTSFTESAKALDSKRLNKQILEAYQILKVLTSEDPRAAWRNHPAAKMWEGHEHALHYYAQAMIREAASRGIKVDKNQYNIHVLKLQKEHLWGNSYPMWYVNPKEVNRVTESHRANLYKKDPEFYFEFRNDMAKPCCDKCQYYWVTHQERNAQKASS